MKNLFSENWPIINTDEELLELCEKFQKYDPSYICQATASSRQKTKSWMESLWKQYEPYADRNFLEEFKLHFAQRGWELYFGVALLNHGFFLPPNKNEGPDFDLQNMNEQRLCWIEAIAIEKGDGVDKVPEIVPNGLVVDVPTEKMTLRLSSGLNEKFQKYLSYLEKNIVSDNEPYVIAIDRSELEHGDALLPNILKALFGIGNPALRMRIGGMPMENPESFWTHQPTIQKNNGQSISMHFFNDLAHAGISAVIYNINSVINSPRDSKEMGENFFIVHNPLAKNPLPKGFFSFGTEYIVEDEHVKEIRKPGKFNKPDPFEWLTD